MSEMPERVWLTTPFLDGEVEGSVHDPRNTSYTTYVPESRLLAAEARVREVEAERDAIHADYVSKVHKVLDLRAERDALVAEVARYKELLLTMEMPDA